LKFPLEIDPFRSRRYLESLKVKQLAIIQYANITLDLLKRRQLYTGATFVKIHILNQFS